MEWLAPLSDLDSLLSSTDFLLIISIIKISQTKVKHPTEHHPAGTEGSDQKMSQSDQIRNQSEHWLKYRDRDTAQITHINIDLSYLHQTHLDKSSSQSPVQLFQYWQWCIFLKTFQIYNKCYCYF